MKTLFSLLVLALPLFAFEMEATHFDKDSKRTKVLFKWKRTEKLIGNTLNAYTTFTDPVTNEIAVQEELVMVDGKVQKYSMDQKQTGEKGEVTAKDGKLLFSYTQEGKTKTNDEDYEENFVVSGSVLDYLLKHKSELMNGNKVKVRFAVLDRRETVGFSFTKEEEKKLDGIDALVLKMKPSSFIIAALVDPLYFTVRKDNFRALEIVGRTLPKRREGKDWKDLDTEAVFSR